VAYGLRLVGVDGGGFLEPADGQPWPEVHVLQSRDQPDPTGEWWLSFGGNRACFRLPGGLLRLNRWHSVMSVRSEHPVPHDVFVHPWLATAGATFARWLGREAFHGGGFVARSGKAWAVLAPKEGGKSTMLGWLAARGHGVVSDDLLVIEGEDVLAGPRCVDLRPGTAEVLGLESVDTEREERRRRIAVDPVPAAIPLAGVVHLAWSDSVEVVPVPVDERIARLRAQNTFKELPAGESALLRLATLPTLELRRPRDFDSIDASGEALLAATS
jgi:hypothetical protein